MEVTWGNVAGYQYLESPDDELERDYAESEVEPVDEDGYYTLADLALRRTL